MWRRESGFEDGMLEDGIRRDPRWFAVGSGRDPYRHIEEKFLRLAARSLDSASAEKLRDAVFEIDRIGAVANILEILK